MIADPRCVTRDAPVPAVLLLRDAADGRRHDGRHDPRHVRLLHCAHVHLPHQQVLAIYLSTISTLISTAELLVIYNIYTDICRFYLARVIVYMLARYGRQEDESQQVTEEGHCALAVMQSCIHN